jgi:FolB domain-containing protein
MDTIYIEGLTARVIIGVHDWEREIPQEICVDLDLFVDLSAAAASDDLADTIDYDDLSRRVLSHAAAAKRLTLEALAGDIALLCLEDPRVRRAIVRVDKPGALAAAESVGVTVERSA